MRFHPGENLSGCGCTRQGFWTWSDDFEVNKECPGLMLDKPHSMDAKNTPSPIARTRGSDRARMAMESTVKLT